MATATILAHTLSLSAEVGEVISADTAHITIRTKRNNHTIFTNENHQIKLPMLQALYTDSLLNDTTDMTQNSVTKKDTKPGHIYNYLQMILCIKPRRPVSKKTGNAKG